MKGILMLLGRLLYALPFGVFGLFCFLNAKDMIKMIPAYLPFHVVWIYFTGACLIGAFIFIFFKIRYANVVAFLLGVMMVAFVCLIHIPGVLTGGQYAHLAVLNLLKDAALGGAAFFIAGALSEK
jgi:uncharacterized membrane protein